MTLKTLNAELQNTGTLNIHISTLSRLLHHLGFKFKKDSNRRALQEKSDIAVKRVNFLRNYVNNANTLERDIIFLDETWIYSRGSVRKSWQDEDTRSVRNIHGYDGKRFIILHAGGSNGFVENASLIFASKSNTSDYHGEMNSDTFTKWISEQLIPNLQQPTLIIMDNAPYHSVVLNKEPSSSWNKAAIMEWLRNNQIHFNANTSKLELYSIVKRNKKEKVYKIDELVREHGHEVLRLPPYHCEFNAIELVWADVKSYYNKHVGGNGYGDAAVLNLWKEALNQCDKTKWINCVRHTNTLIQEWYKREQFLDNVQPLVISVDQDEDDTESNSD